MNWRVETPEAYPGHVETVLVGREIKFVDFEGPEGDLPALATHHESVCITLASGKKIVFYAEGGKIACTLFD